MIDFHRPRDLHHGLIEKAVLFLAFPGNPAQIDKNADIATDFIQRGRLLFSDFFAIADDYRGGRRIVPRPSMALDQKAEPRGT